MFSWKRGNGTSSTATASGLVRRNPGYTDRKATDQLAAELERRAARQAEGLIDPYEDHRKRPLLDHMEELAGTAGPRRATPHTTSSSILGRLPNPG